jgi:hypothetical protein
MARKTSELTYDERLTETPCTSIMEGPSYSEARLTISAICTYL